MPEGTVKWFSGSFGNIEQDGGKDAYVHYSVIQSDGFKYLHKGDRLTNQL